MTDADADAAASAAADSSSDSAHAPGDAVRAAPWNAGRWSRDPVAVRTDEQGIVVEAAEGSDFWRTTHYGFVHDDGHALLAPWPTDAAVEVSFDTSTLTGLYDQAGLMLYVGDEQWVKAGIEVNDDVLHVGAVVTNRVSDWSLAPVPDWAGQVVTVRASRSGVDGDAVTLRARAGEGEWRTIRVAPFDADAATAGPLACAPMRAGLEVRFTRWAFVPADVDLHEDPPAA
jgi:regulation of enolase protein 1 (concanavalin A-like superfamily)